MSNPVVVLPDDPIINSLNFNPYRSTVLRRAVPFIPDRDEPQTMEVVTPWGAKLTAKNGDLLVSELDKPNDIWPIDAKIFDETYLIVAPGLCVKRAITMLVPLIDLTMGDEDRMVTVHTYEGEVTVRAGDFFLAKGVKGELWPYPKEKVVEKMKPAS
jgi:hypothetical protein